MTSIGLIFNNLPDISFVCDYHKRDIIEGYVNHFPTRQIEQDFKYSFDVPKIKCAVPSCPRDAQIKLIKQLPVEVSTYDTVRGGVSI